MRIWYAALVMLLLLPVPASAHSPNGEQASPAAVQPTDAGGPADKHKDPRADDRFPQPILAGRLPGRRLIEPEETQHVLGWVQGVVRQKDGSPALVVETGGWLSWIGIGTHDVLVPTGDVAILGEHVALMDIDPDDFKNLPWAKPGANAPIPAGETLRIGIVKPFH